MIGDEDVPTALLIDLAKIWLDEQSETSSRRVLLEQQLGELEARLPLVMEAARIREETPSPEDLEGEASERAARRQSQLEEAHSAVRTAQQRLDRQAEIEADIAERRSELEAATSAEEAVAAALAGAEIEADAAAEAEHAAASERARRESELASAADAERRATAALGELSTRLTAAAQTDDSSALERAVADAQAAVDQAAIARQQAAGDLAATDAQLANFGGDGTNAVIPAAAAGVEELEWYLLSRVAAQRSVSYAGSVPLVLDDALAEVHGPDLVHLLSRLERMSTAVQVIVVSEDEQVASWADSVGTDRAMTLFPLPV
jgi:chromosome segregation ATPase